MSDDGLNAIVKRFPPEIINKIFDYLPPRFLRTLTRDFPECEKFVYCSRRLVRIDGVDLDHVPLNKIRSAAIGSVRDERRWRTEAEAVEKTLSRFGSEALTSLAINVPLPSSCDAEFLERLKATSLAGVTSLSFETRSGNLDSWSPLWMRNRGLKSLRAFSDSNVVFLRDLPSALQELEATNLDVGCLAPCRKSLVSLRIVDPSSRFCDRTVFPKLRTLKITGRCSVLPIAPVLTDFCLEGNGTWHPSNLFPFLQEISRSVERLRVESLTLSQTPSFDKLRDLCVEKLYRRSSFDNLPALRSLRFCGYVEGRNDVSESALPFEALRVNTLIVEESDSDCSHLTKYLKGLKALKKLTVKCDRRFDLQRILNSVDARNVEYLRLTVRSSERVNLSRFERLKVLKIECPSARIICSFPVLDVLTVTKKSYRVPIEDAFDLGETPIKVIELVLNMIIIDFKLLRLCLKGGLRILRLDLDGWKYDESAHLFYDTLKAVGENEVFAIHAVVDEKHRREFKTNVCSSCTKLNVLEFVPAK